MNEETIVAIATPPGRGGVGIVRLSGKNAYTIASQVTNKIKFEPRQVYFCNFYDQTHTLIDQGLLLYFKAPYSFTGEDVIEMHSHGSPVVLDALVQLCVAYGCRLAKPGEFSERAFLNDKMDLTQAEAIADLIHASSSTAAKLAVSSLQGAFSKRINAINEHIIHLRLYVEAAIDFPEEDIDFLNDGKIITLLNQIIDDLIKLRANANQGSMLREGLSIVIAGLPNAGKSTLINQLAGREVAIVTDIAGTTRDIMREQVLLDDIPIHLIDTAGLRDSDDPIEQEGIKRAWNEVKQADCILLVVDVAASNHEATSVDVNVRQILPPNVPILKIFNKIDKLEQAPTIQDNAIFLSAKSGIGIELLKDKIKEVVGFHSSEGIFLARRRHLQAIDDALAYLRTGQKQLLEHQAGELLADDLRYAHHSLCEITGEFTSDDLLGKIFSSFCIGK